MLRCAEFGSFGSRAGLSSVPTVPAIPPIPAVDGAIRNRRRDRWRTVRYAAAQRNDEVGQNRSRTGSDYPNSGAQLATRGLCSSIAEDVLPILTGGLGGAVSWRRNRN